MTPRKTPWAAAYAMTSAGLTWRLKVLTIASAKPTRPASSATPIGTWRYQEAAPTPTTIAEQDAGLDDDVVHRHALRRAVDRRDVLGGGGRRRKPHARLGRAQRSRCAEDGVVGLHAAHVGVDLLCAAHGRGRALRTTYGRGRNVPGEVACARSGTRTRTPSQEGGFKPPVSAVPPPGRGPVTHCTAGADPRGRCSGRGGGATPPGPVHNGPGNRFRRPAGPQGSLPSHCCRDHRGGARALPRRARQPGVPRAARLGRAERRRRPGRPHRRRPAGPRAVRLGLRRVGHLRLLLPHLAGRRAAALRAAGPLPAPPAHGAVRPAADGAGRLARRSGDAAVGRLRGAHRRRAARAAGGGRPQRPAGRRARGRARTSSRAR